jgi:hyperosmotically inducible periplasmic protein
MDQHRVRRTVHAILLTGVWAVSMTAISVIAQTPADNTKVNERDRAKGAVTADQQKENTGDRDVTRKIRQSLMRDKTLSSYAHNVKVIAQDGQVTLKGPVRSDDERRIVEAKATEVAGAGHVTNEMSVARARSKSAKE